MTPSDGPPAHEVLTVSQWPTNGHMIADMHRIGYLTADAYILDATYGIGQWWTQWRPDRLVTNDLDPDKPADHHHDFQDLPYGDETFDAATFDPAYISPGGRKTSTIPAFNGAYGIGDCPATPDALRVMNEAGLTEVVRVVRRRNVGRAAKRDGTWHPGGLILVKGMNYVTSGRLYPALFHMWEHATGKLGLELVDHFVHLRKPGSQPKERGKPDADGNRKPHVQQHGRSNCSHLLIFRRTA